MSLVKSQKKVNSPVLGNLEKIVEFLSIKSREILAKEFYEELKEIRTPQGARLLATGQKHMSNKTILELAAMSKEARKRILELAKAEAEEVLSVIAAMEAEEE
uniref:Uncharacterized protein n=1 Tax=Saccharolobus islandicus TaxID=43080 RepID=Q5W2P5_SACIS|nr:hypothetical protein [Sulfolobus islandicus]CAG38164.1 hypothetical protein [Sulfolobus islandicus]CAG38251.1 hypothetical protein [Sulfolobus islandicus]